MSSPNKNRNRRFYLGGGADPDEQSANSRQTNLSRGSTFSTRDFNVVDQSVNLMDLELTAKGVVDRRQSKRPSTLRNLWSRVSLGGGSKRDLEIDQLSKFSDDLYGDADMNEADAEEYIDSKQRRFIATNPKSLLTVFVAMMAVVLVVSTLHSMEAKKIQDQNKKETIQELDNDTNVKDIDTMTEDEKKFSTNPKADDKLTGKDKHYHDIFMRIVDYGITSRDVFLNKETPQRKALDWIANEDPAKLKYETTGILDRYGLAVLYFSTYDKESPWPVHENWMSEKGICSWYGISCVPKEQVANEANNFEPFTSKYNANDAVTAIQLPTNMLKGAIPGELGTAMSSLVTIDLEDNQLTGTLPENLAKNKKLHDFFVARNNLVGTIPEQYAINWHQLHQFSVAHNQLEGSLPDVFEKGGWSHLKQLDVSHNDLKGSFPDLSKLPRLTGLFLEGNSFTGTLPESIGGMSGLLDLRIGENKFSGSIDVLSNLMNLESLHLANNKFSGEIPDMFDQLFRLHELVLADNEFTGTIPRTLTHLQGLRTLNLDGNKLEGTLPGGLGVMTDITTISLRNNQFEGTIPTILGKLDDIQTLNLDHNNLSGTVPTELGLCFRLSALHLHENSFTGAIPSQLGDLPVLSNLRLEANDFSGVEMPPQICALREDDLSILTSDCKKTNQVTCDCCTECH